MATDPYPPDANIIIWRYMDDWKFKEFLGVFSEHSDWHDDAGKTTKYFNAPGQLWFAYPSSFHADVGNHNEGTMPAINDDPEAYFDRMAEARGYHGPEETELKKRFLAADTLVIRDCNVLIAQLCGVSCWHRNFAISADMWDFAPSKNGVAVRTTVGQLEHALTYTYDTISRIARPSVCAVGYVDYSDYFLEYDGYRSILAIVEEMWSYENEIRFVAKSPSILRLPLSISKPWSLPGPVPTITGDELQQHLERLRSEARAEFLAVREGTSPGFSLPLNLEGLIDEVVIKPGADTTYLSSVRHSLDQVGLKSVPVSAA